MKKHLSIIALLLCLVLVFAGCTAGGNDDSGQNVDPAPQGGMSSDTGNVDGNDPGTDALTPVYAKDLKDGTYEITVNSSSSMFSVVSCELTVENGAMQAVMTMSGDGYGKVYMGTGEAALQDSEDKYINFVPDETGAYTFTVPVEALDKEIDCAAWSIKKEQWYDRTLTFLSSDIPADALIGE